MPNMVNLKMVHETTPLLLTPFIIPELVLILRVTSPEYKPVDKNNVKKNIESEYSTFSMLNITNLRLIVTPVLLQKMQDQI